MLNQFNFCFRGDLTKFTMEGMELDNRHLPVLSSFNSLQPSTNGISLINANLNLPFPFLIGKINQKGFNKL